MAITQDSALKALSTVQEPDLKKDLVTLNMIRDLKIDGTHVSFTIVLTTPACPLKDKMKNDCEAALSAIGATSVSVDFDAAVTQRMTKDEVLPNVKNIILVSSGKGGVGKSTVSANLALSLARAGASVGLLDADVYGPSIPMMFGIQDIRPAMGKVGEKSMIEPVEVHGVKVISIGLLIDPHQAVVWRGPMASSALRQFFTDVNWGNLDYLVIDMPPGTGDVHLTIAQLAKVAGAIVVTTPQPVAVADATKGAYMFRMEQINIPILGVVENMSWFEPAELPGHKYPIFGEGGGQKLALRFACPLLAQIPLVMGMADEKGFEGQLVLTNEGVLAESFNTLAGSVARQISVLNAENPS